jgi:hypothetical protein
VDEAEQQERQRIVGDMETARFSDGLAAKAEAARVEPKRFDSERLNKKDWLPRWRLHDWKLSVEVSQLRWGRQDLKLNGWSVIQLI